MPSPKGVKLVGPESRGGGKAGGERKGGEAYKMRGGIKREQKGAEMGGRDSDSPRVLSTRSRMGGEGSLRGTRASEDAER